MRPMKLLERQRKGAHKQIAEANARSPLLSLPPEVRNQIYSYVLGGNTLHVQRNFVNVCHELDTDEEKIDKIRQQTVPARNFEYSSHHPHCKVLQSQDLGVNVLPLDLLQTCSQIHEEAAPLPFSANIFSFSYDNAFNLTIKQRFVASQRRTIKEITFFARCIKSVSLKSISQLSGLKRATLFGVFHPSGGMYRKIRKNEYMKSLTSLADVLEKSSVQEATVFLTPCWKYFRGPVDDNARHRQIKDADAASHALERRITTPWSEEAVCASVEAEKALVERERLRCRNQVRQQKGMRLLE